MAEGRKDDGGKVRLDLIPPELLFGVGEILTFGAKKYTWRYETEWDRLLDVKNVIKIKITTQTECVVVVTKETSDKLILSTPNDKDKIVGIGKNEILTKLRHTPNVGKIVQKLVEEISKPSGLGYSESSILPKKNIETYVREVAKYVEELNTYTLTIVMKLGDSEVSYVQNATMDLDFWETMWRDLKGLYDISRPVDTTGERNWELGMDWSRVFGALMRHMWSWWKGEKLDPETGKSHLWHAGCCIAFLIAYEERNVGNDDRPV